MLNAGITQKEVARHFNITQPTLCKKLKAQELARQTGKEQA
jgi:DNA-binding transcriptional regulator LsrR (DeoR family)